MALTSPLGRSLLSTTLALGRLATSAVESVLPDGSGRLAWRELGNKIEAFRWFDQGRSGVPPAAGGADDFTRLWRTEGEGYRRAEHGTAGPVRGDAATLLPLHTGLGLSLASRALAGLAASRPEALAPALDGFLAAARESAAPGWEGAVIEALGLVARTLHPHRMRSIDDALRGRSGAVRELFWHGVGRGVYFAPTQAVPMGGAAHGAAERALAEASDETARAEALAGVVWALTLVNLRSPEVVEALLVRRAESLAPGGPVEHGVGAALVVWTAAAGRDAVLERFLGHAPRTAAAADAWRRVLDPCARCLDRLVGGLAATGRWQELFHYRPLHALADDLESAAGRAP